MKRILVNIVSHTDKIPDIEQLLPLESETVGKWKAEGVLEHLFLKQDKSGVYLVFKDVEEADVQKLIPTLPLSKFFEKIEYSVLDKPF